MELKLLKAETDAVKMALLIVPYGIETHSWQGSDLFKITFNCTLWN